MLDVARKPIIPRPALIDRLLGRPEPVLVINAPAGMGKSTLLAEIARRTGRPVHVGEMPPPFDADEQLLWDIPPGTEPAPLPERLVCGGARIIIAKRTGTVLPGLARAVAYGHAATMPAGELLFTRDDLIAHFDPTVLDRVIAETGGW